VLLVAAGLGSHGEHTLISLLALNGLRVSGATGADIEHRGLERGHRTLVIRAAGWSPFRLPQVPARAIDLAIGERTDGPLFLTADGQRLTGTAPFGSCAALPAAPGSSNMSARTLRHAFITGAIDAGVPLRDVQKAASQCHIAIRRSRLPPSPPASSGSAAQLEGLTAPDLACQQR
jgi:integrase